MLYEVLHAWLPGLDQDRLGGPGIVCVQDMHLQPPLELPPLPRPFQQTRLSAKTAKAAPPPLRFPLQSAAGRCMHETWSARHQRTSDVDLELAFRTRYLQSFVRPTCRCVSCSVSCCRHISLRGLPPILRSLTYSRRPLRVTSALYESVRFEVPEVVPLQVAGIT